MSTVALLRPGMAAIEHTRLNPLAWRRKSRRQRLFWGTLVLRLVLCHRFEGSSGKNIHPPGKPPVIRTNMLDRMGVANLSMLVVALEAGSVGG